MVARLRGRPSPPPPPRIYPRIQSPLNLAKVAPLNS